MILTAFRLRRDRNTERESFGYTRLSSHIENIPTYSPMLGCPIEIPTILKTNIIKIVEYYNRSTGPVVVERLCWKFGSSLYPFKARFISLQHTRHDTDLLFLKNMGTIHEKLTGNQVSFSSALEWHFNTYHSLNQWFPNFSYEYLEYLTQKYGDYINKFSYLSDDWNAAKKFMRLLDDDLNYDYVENQFTHVILPKPTIQDPFTQNNSSTFLHTRGLAFENCYYKPFDVSQPQEIEIKHPEKTLYSPKECHGILKDLHHIASEYTDLNLEYILSGTVTISKNHKLCVNRYGVSQTQDLSSMFRLILPEILVVLHYYYPDIRLVGDVRISVEMTYGDESLIEVYDATTNDFLGGIHFDLAMLSLCAPNIAVTVDPF